MVHRVNAMIGQLYTKASGLSGYLRVATGKKVGATPVFTSINAHQPYVAGFGLSCV
jgi:hypothetical protein